MPIMDEQVRNDAREMLADVKNPVKLLMVTQTFECQYCEETRNLAEEVANLSDYITVEVRNFITDDELVKAHNIDKIPAITVLGPDDKDYGIHFYGIPAGYEFTSLLEAIKMVGTGENLLQPETIAFLDELTEPLHLEVFVTPTCPYCPRAVVLAHYMALASDMVTADMVEATEFPHLSIRYSVMGVPRTVINEDTDLFIEGAAPEPMVVAKIRDAVTAAV